MAGLRITKTMSVTLAAVIASALSAGAPAQAQQSPGLSITWDKRTFPAAECIRRGHAVAKSLGGTSGGNEKTVWVYHAGMTTGVRCDIPDTVLFVTAANARGATSAEHQRLMQLFRAATTPTPAAPVAKPAVSNRPISFPLYLTCDDAGETYLYKLTANDVTRKTASGAWNSEFDSKSATSVIVTSRNGKRVYTQGYFEIIFDPVTFGMEFSDEELEDWWEAKCVPTATR